MLVESIVFSHLDYLGRVDDFIGGKIDDAKPSHYTKCKLGSWYYGLGAAVYGEHPVWLELGNLHQQFHEVTDQAILHKNQNQIGLAQEGLSRAYTLFGRIEYLLLQLPNLE
jgi:hypothetical protein